LLIAPFVSVLQNLLLACEKELNAIDMVTNVKKSSCVRVGPRHRVTCAAITTSNRDNLSWINKMRYSGIFIACHVSIRCSDARQITQTYFLSWNECNFCQGWSPCLRGGDTEVDCLKCLPILTFGLKVRALRERVLQSLDFTVNVF